MKKKEVEVEEENWEIKVPFTSQTPSHILFPFIYT